MKILYKFLCLTLVLALTAFAFSACKGNEEAVTEEVKNEAEINAKYDEMMKSEEVELLPEDYNPIVNNFTVADFQFTLEDDTLAFNLPENSYTKITPSGATFGFYTETVPADYFEGSFKTAKGVKIADGKDALVASYKIGDANIFADENGNFIFAFATDGNYEYSALSSADAKGIFDIYTSSVASAEDSGANVMAQYGAYKSVALVCINTTAEGTINLYEMHRFDKSEE